MKGHYLSKFKPCVFLSVVICIVLLSVNTFAYEPSSREIGARSAVIMDGDKVLYAKNPTFKQPPASTTKLVTAMVVLDHMKPHDVVTITGNAARLHSPNLALREGERFYVKDLLSLLLMRSVNGAALAFAEAVSGDEKDFVALMNAKARSIGATDTRFINSHGLPGEGQYITAYDLADIMRRSLDYCLIKETINTKTKTVSSLDGRTFILSNTNKLLWSDDDLVGGKTGFTNAARHCLAFAAEKGDNTLVAALLGDDRRSDLWRDAKFVLSKGHDISESNSKPVIYYSTVADEKVLKIAKTSRAGKGKKHKSKRHKVGKGNRTDNIAALDMAQDTQGDDANNYMAKKSKANKSKAQVHNVKSEKLKQVAKKPAPCRTAYKGVKQKNCTSVRSSNSNVFQIVLAASSDNIQNIGG
ncbi:MAG: D-alanyl-D-alanine carboxypeptidase [Nitrospirota bacterium]